VEQSEFCACEGHAVFAAGIGERIAVEGSGRFDNDGNSVFGGDVDVVAKREVAVAAVGADSGRPEPKRVGRLRNTPRSARSLNPLFVGQEPRTRSWIRHESCSLSAVRRLG